MKLLRIVLMAATTALTAAILAADPLQIDPRQTFTGPGADSSVMTVELSNSGPDARGSLTVTSESGQIDYPVELPRGARKQIVTFPGVGYGQIDFSLRTNQGTVTKTVPAVFLGYENSLAALLIGDDEGSLAFLRRQGNDRKAIAANDIYVAPDAAPGRGAAYGSFASVVLGPGSERISDETVAALKNYALEGGTLIFVGGASSPTLSDRRWADTITGSGWQPKTVPHLDALAEAGGESLRGPLTILQATNLSPGTMVHRDGAAIFETERGFGLGQVVVLGYNPFEAPLTTWPGRGRALLRYIRNTAGIRATAFLSGYQGLTSPRYAPGLRVVGPPGLSPSVPPRAFSSSGTADGDPFDTRLPALTTVFGMLALYFVLVVPVNFLILRKLRRGELAWITAPVLSLAFAGILFRSAQSLYAASLSTATQGVLIVQQGTNQALYSGRAQMFFPRGGTYDLGLKNVDQVRPVTDQVQNFGSIRTEESSTEGFNLVDDGEVTAPRFEASNLAFRQASFTQQVLISDWIQIVDLGDGRCRVENRSPYDLSDAYLARSNVQSSRFTVPAGGTAAVSFEKGDQATPEAQLPNEDVRNFTRKTPRIALVGAMSGFRPGPQLGNEVVARTKNTLVFLTDEAKR